MTAAFVRDCSLLLAQRPVIHAVPVAASANLVANALLAAGASPVMAQYPAEISAIHGRCSAVVLSLGSPDRGRFTLLRTVAKSADRRGLPVVLDPVGVAVGPHRLKAAQALVQAGTGWILRGNRTEIQALGGVTGSGGSPIDGDTGGPDIPPWETPSQHLSSLASRHVLLATGPTDYLWAHPRTHRDTRGHPIQARVTGMGCALAALCGAFAAVNPDRFEAALHALWLANTAAEEAGSRARGPGTFVPEWLDALAGIVGNFEKSVDQQGGPRG